MSGMQASSLRKCVFYKPELTAKVPHGTETKFLRFKTEIN